MGTNVLELFCACCTTLNHGVHTLELFITCWSPNFVSFAKVLIFVSTCAEDQWQGWGKNLSEEPATDDFKTFSGLCHTLVF